MIARVHGEREITERIKIEWGADEARMWSILRAASHLVCTTILPLEHWDQSAMHCAITVGSGPAVLTMREPVAGHTEISLRVPNCATESGYSLMHSLVEQITALTSAGAPPIPVGTTESDLPF